MMKTLRRTLALLTLMSASLPLLAEESPTWYEVEVIVFKQWEAGGDDAESLPLNPPVPQFQRVASPAPASAAPGTPFRLLPPQRLQLHGVYQRLEEAGPYEPLLHIGWEQPGLPEAESVALAVPAGWQPPQDAPAADQLAETEPQIEPQNSPQRPPLHGLLRVYVERYLHIRADLRYARASDWGDGATQVMQQHRRMRSREIHYLDHPALGILVQVTPMSTPPGADDEAAAAQPAAAGDVEIEEEALEPASQQAE